MFRTRDLFVVVLSLILTALCVGIAFWFLPEPEVTQTKTQEVVFAEPQETYEVVPYEEENTLKDEREAFIRKVKQTYFPDVPNPEPAEESRTKADTVTGGGAVTAEREEKDTTPSIPPAVTPPIEVPQQFATTTGATTTNVQYGNIGL